MIIIKDQDVLKAILQEEYHPQLVIMALETVQAIEERCLDATLTSAYRRGDKGVHGAFRGIDFRTWTMTSEDSDYICHKINSRWEYDPQRPDMVCLIRHDVGQGDHLHLQSHPHTRLIT